MPFELRSPSLNDGASEAGVVCRCCNATLRVERETFAFYATRRGSPTEHIILSGGALVHRCVLTAEHVARGDGPVFVSLARPPNDHGSVATREDTRVSLRAMATRAFEALASSAIGAVCDIRVIARPALRLYEMTSDDVVAALDALEAAQVSVFLAGGWGIDALLGSQTRPHRDLDVLIPDESSQIDAAIQALVRAGYRFLRQRPPSVHMPRRLNFADGRGRSVDLLPIDASAPPFTNRDDLASPFTIGRIGDRAVSCLTGTMQLKMHERVPVTPTSARDVARVEQHLAESGQLGEHSKDETAVRATVARSEREPSDTGHAISRVKQERRGGAALARARLLAPPTALIIPVPQVEPFIAQYRSRYDPAALLGMPAHVTVFYPFVRTWPLHGTVEATLRAAFSRCHAFRFRFDRVETFPGVLYLAPDPPDPFIAATKAVQQWWPRRQPYGGIHSEIVPHLSVAHDDWPSTLKGDLEALLPVEAEAREVWWLEQDRSGHWQTRLRIPLRDPGPAAATRLTATSCD